MPGIEDETKFVIAKTCVLSKLRPFFKFTKTDAVGGVWSRTKTDFSGRAKCTLAALTLLISVIDFANSKVIDQSALKAIEDIAEKYSNLGKQLKLRHLTKDCHRLLRKTGQLIVDSDDDPDYGIAVDYGVKLGIFGK